MEPQRRRAVRRILSAYLSLERREGGEERTSVGCPYRGGRTCSHAKLGAAVAGWQQSLRRHDEKLGLYVGSSYALNRAPAIRNATSETGE